MTIVGLTFISVMSGDSLIKGLMAGGMGMVISFVAWILTVWCALFQPTLPPL